MKRGTHTRFKNCWKFRMSSRPPLDRDESFRFPSMTVLVCENALVPLA